MGRRSIRNTSCYLRGEDLEEALVVAREGDTFIIRAPNVCMAASMLAADDPSFTLIDELGNTKHTARAGFDGHAEDVACLEAGL